MYTHLAGLQERKSDIPILKTIYALKKRQKTKSRLNNKQKILHLSRVKQL